MGPAQPPGVPGWLSFRPYGRDRVRRRAQGGNLVRLVISPAKTAIALALVVACLTSVSFVGYLLEPLLGEFVKLISVASDSGLPAWYSSLALLFCSALLAAIALARRRQGGDRVLHWGVLCAVFVYLAADEMLTLHERASSKVVQPVLGLLGYEPGGVLNYPWVILYAPLVLIFALAYVRFWFALPPRTQVLFLAAGALFVGGGIGVEMFNALYDYLYGRGDLVAAVMTHLEEFLEMIGVVVFAYALMSHVASDPQLRDLAVGIGEGPGPAAAPRGEAPGGGQAGASAKSFSQSA